MRIASVNFYVFNKSPRADVRMLKNLNINAIGFQESQNHLHLIADGLPEHQILWNKKNNTYGAREVAVALSNDNRLIDYHGREVSDVEAGEERKVFKSRWITIVKFRRGRRKVALINYHGNAAIQDKQGRLYPYAERVREWLEASVIINRTIRRLQKRGFDIMVTGDWNYRRRSGVRGFILHYWSPQAIFERRNLEYVEHGVDYVAWSKFWAKTGLIRISPAEHGGDHPWLIVDLLPRRLTDRD